MQLFPHYGMNCTFLYLFKPILLSDSIKLFINFFIEILQFFWDDSINDLTNKSLFVKIGATFEMLSNIVLNQGWTYNKLSDFYIPNDIIVSLRALISELFGLLLFFPIKDE